MNRPTEREICALIGCPHVDCRIGIRECSNEMSTGWAGVLLDLSSTTPMTPAVKLTYDVEGGTDEDFCSLESFIEVNIADPELADLIRSLDPGKSMDVDEAAACVVTRLW